jgi:phage portal protein BeeE
MARHRDKMLLVSSCVLLYLSVAFASLSLNVYRERERERERESRRPRGPLCRLSYISTEPDDRY